MPVDRVRKSNSRLDGLIPYDPKSLAVDVFLSANENPYDVPAGVKAEMFERLAKLSFNRYPDPLADGLRGLIAEKEGLEKSNVLVGNGGDEQLFNIFLAYGGPGRVFLNIPPTFSVYAANARLTGADVVEVKRFDDFTIDEDAVCERVARGDIDLVIVGSPNNPTADLADAAFVERLLDCSDALVMVDEAYIEFSGRTLRRLIGKHENLVLLRTFSKAFSLAGARIGYILASPSVISEFCKVRQPYSIDAIAQTVACTVLEHRGEFQQVIDGIVERRALLQGELSSIDGVEVFPSDANFLLIRLPHAHEVWETMLEKSSVLVRDFSSGDYTRNCLRVTVGTGEENGRLLEALRSAMDEVGR